jgi:hypothetical protein
VGSDAHLSRDNFPHKSIDPDIPTPPSAFLKSTRIEYRFLSLRLVD